MSDKLKISTIILAILFLYVPVTRAQPLKRLRVERADVQTPGERWGLFVGIEDYEDPLVTDLRYSIDDVKIVTEILGDPRRGAFEHLKVLTSDATEEELRPTRLNIMDALNNWLSRAKPEDTVLFFFSGHGTTDTKNRNYLVPVDAKVNLLEDSAILMARVNEILDDRHRIQAEKVLVILDSCHSGAKVGQRAFMVEGKILDPLFTNAEGRITFASCSRDESSYEHDTLGHGVFSYYIAEGLKGAGDADQDGHIDADELFNYVDARVRNWTGQRGYKQTPRKQANVAGQILLGLHPENLARRRQEVEVFNTYKTKLRAIVALDATELAEAEGLLLRQLMAEPLTETDIEQVKLIRNLADGQISLETYRLAVKGLKVEKPTPTPIQPIQTSPEPQPFRTNPVMTPVTKRISISGGYNLGETKEFNYGVAGVLNLRYGLSPNLSANGKIGIVASPNADAFLVGELLVHSPLGRNLFMNIGGGGGFYRRSDESGSALSVEAGIGFLMGQRISLDVSVLAVLFLAEDTGTNILPHIGISTAF